MKKFFPFFCIVLTLCLTAENLLFRHLMLDETPWSYPWIALLSDLALPLVLLLMMLFHNRRIWLILFSLSFSFVMILKTANIILYSRIMEILTFANCSLLWTHTNFETLRILFGSLWYLKAAGVLLVICLLPGLLIFSGMRFFTDASSFFIKNTPS